MTDNPDEKVASGEIGHDSTHPFAPVRIVVVGNADLTNVYWSLTPNHAEVSNHLWSDPRLPGGAGGSIVWLLNSSGFYEGKWIRMGAPIEGLQIKAISFPGNQMTAHRAEGGLAHFQAQDMWMGSVPLDKIEKFKYTVTIENTKTNKSFTIDPEVDAGPPGVG